MTIFSFLRAMSLSLTHCHIALCCTFSVCKNKFYLFFCIIASVLLSLYASIQNSPNAFQKLRNKWKILRNSKVCKTFKQNQSILFYLKQATKTALFSSQMDFTDKSKMIISYEFCISQQFVVTQMTWAQILNYLIGPIWKSFLKPRCHYLRYLDFWLIQITLCRAMFHIYSL